ncbi:MAG: hypothetical protein JJU27_06660, partial [Gammaproteobacteria bacterium]|nr:hypothetical protein [Gammaproteobacteria bacterium]
DAVRDSGLAISREADEDDDAVVRVDGPPLQLVQQLGPEPRRDRDTPGPSGAPAVLPTPAPEPEPEPEPVPPRCVAIGPFSELGASDAFADILRARGFAPTRQAEDGSIWTGYWLFAEYSEREAARNAAAILRDGGVDDAYVIPGEGEFTVSLGVFSVRARAERLLADAAELGVTAQLRDRFRSGTVYWLTLAIPGDASISPPEPGPGAREVSVEARECPPR